MIIRKIVIQQNEFSKTFIVKLYDSDGVFVSKSGGFQNIDAVFDFIKSQENELCQPN